MSTEISVDYVWIPRSAGGHRSPPYNGFRATIRWQRYIRDHMERSRDVEGIALTYDSETRCGTATLRLVSDDALPAHWLEEGNLVELLDGYTVIAIGRIVAP